MPRLIWVFAGRTLILIVLSCRGSCIFKRMDAIYCSSARLKQWNTWNWDAHKQTWLLIMTMAVFLFRKFDFDRNTTRQILTLVYRVFVCLPPSYSNLRFSCIGYSRVIIITPKVIGTRSMDFNYLHLLIIYYFMLFFFFNHKVYCQYE